jgi:membrane-bound ClpP family serine protease
MTWIIIVSLIVVGIIFLLLEILVVPGTAVAGLFGLGLVVAGVVVAFNNYGTNVGALTLVGSLVFSVISIALALKSNTWKKAMLGSEIDSRVNVIEVGRVVAGDEGLSITRLNPMGKAQIGDDYFEVSSKDNLIAENTPIVVVKVDGNKIIVKPKS